MAKFDFDKPVASFSWYLQNGSADDKRGNRLHVGTGQKAQIYFDPESGEFIGKLKYVDDYIDLADGAKQHFELPRTAREYKPSDFSPKFPISNVKFEVDESVKDFIHVLPRGLFFYQNEFYDAVFGDKTDYPESLKDFLFTRTGDIEAAGEFYGAIEKWPQSVYCTLVEKCNVENRPIPEYENDRVLPLDHHKELLASLKDYFGCGESNYRTPGDLIAARSYGSYLSGISLKFNPQDVIAAVEHATETVQAELVPYLSDSFGPDRYLPCGCHVTVPMNNSIENAAQSIKELRDAGVDLDALPNCFWIKRGYRQYDDSSFCCIQLIIQPDALSCKTSRLRSCPMRKIVPILCILALSLSGCSSTTLLRNGVDELRDYIASENAKTKKKLDDRLNKKISTLNRAISEKNEEIIFELMADDLREDGDKLKSQLKDFVNFIPGKIVETSNRSWGTLIHAENYKDAPDNVIERKIWPHDDEGNYYCSVRVYRLSYLAIDDQGTEYEITMEYIKSNEANPEEIGLNYVSIFKTDPDSDEMIRAGRTWE